MLERKVGGSFPVLERKVLTLKDVAFSWHDRCAVLLLPRSWLMT